MDDGRQKGGIPQRINECPEEKYLNKFVKDAICGNTSNPDIWKDLGIILMGQESVLPLNMIEINNPGNVKRCCSEMFSLWRQRQPKANWSQLINALKEISFNTLADKIGNLLLPPMEQQPINDVQHMQQLGKNIGYGTTQAPVITRHPQDILILKGHYGILEVAAYGTNPLHYQWYYEGNVIPTGENKGFYCIAAATLRSAGHYYCQVKNQYGVTNSAVATVAVTVSPTTRSPSVDTSFTYLPNLISNKEFSMPQMHICQEDLTNKISDATQESIDSESIDAAFASFVDDIFDILDEDNFSKIQRKSLENLNVVGGISLSEDIENKIENSKNLSGLFVVLSRHCRPYWNWMNIRMLERLAGNSSKAKQLIKKYKDNVYSRKVKDIMSEICGLEVPTIGYTEIREKWNKDFNDLKVRDVVKHWNELERRFNVKEAMLLKSLTSGCVEIYWLLPNNLVEQAKCSATKSQQGRDDDNDDQSNISIQNLFPELFYLKVGDFVIKDDITNDTLLTTAKKALTNYFTRKETVQLEYFQPSCSYIPLSLFCLKEKYTKLEAISVARMLTLMGTITHEPDSSIHGKITENINDLFTSYEEFASVPYVLLLEGAAGIGKSTLCKEIAIQWANKSILTNQDLLFLLFMHDPEIENITDVGSLVKYFLQSEILADKITEYLIETDGKCLTIIIDGYNMNSGNRFITDSIIGRKILKQCDLVITSRFLAASSHVHKIVQYRALVLGFTKDNQIAFFNDALKNIDSDINYLEKYLHCNQLIKSLCNIPLIMSLLLWLVKEKSNIAKINQVTLIINYIMTIIMKKITTVSLDNLPQLYHHVIKNLSQFAFIAVQSKYHSFTVAEILELCEDHFQAYWHKLGFLNYTCGLGILNRIPFEKQTTFCDLFHFHHVAIQEYLAAFYISLLPDNELLTLLISTFWNIRYFNVWIMYIGITGGKNPVFELFLSGSQMLGTSSASIKMQSSKVNICLYQLYCMKEADSDFDYTLLGQDIDLNNQELSHDHLHTLAVLLLSISTSKTLENLSLSNCNIDDEGCEILYEIFCPNAQLNFETVDISYNNFHWESFNTICCKLKFCHVKNLVYSTDALYDTVTTNLINNFTAMLNENFANDAFSDEILLLTYIAKQNKLIFVYSSPTRIRWLELSDCQLNQAAIKLVKNFVQNKIENKTFRIAFSYHLINYYTNVDLSTLFGDLQSKQLCGSFMHSKGAYLLNVSSIIDCQYSSPQELIADYLSAVLSQDTPITVPYIESIPSAYVTAVENSLQTVLSGSLSTFDISDNYIDSKIASEIAIMMSFINNIKRFYADNNNLLSENAVKIAKGLQNISTLIEFSINNNNVGEGAADDIATVLSRNINLQILNLQNNNFNSAGMIIIAKALKNISTLTKLDVSNNNVGKEAAEDIAIVLSHNNKLRMLDLKSNSFSTVGMIKISRALQNISTLTYFSISNNNVGEEAADDIATVLFHNNKLQTLDLENNSFSTAGLIKIANALQNISTLTYFSISNNDIGEEAVDDIATVLSHNNNLQILDIKNNSFNTAGMIKIARALQNISTLTYFSISNNNIGEEAADDVATVLSHNNKLQALDLENNSFNTAGMIKIARALQNISTLTLFDISSNNIGEVAADDIATVLYHSNKLQELYLQNNSFNTAGMIKIASSLQNISTLTYFNISNNNIGEEAADDIATVLSHNNKLQTLDLENNSFNTAGMIKIARALQSLSTLTWLSISNNNVGKEAGEYIATVLFHNSDLEEVYLYGNNFQAVGAIKVTEALKCISTLVKCNISNNNIEEKTVNIIRNILSCNPNLNLRI